MEARGIWGDIWHQEAHNSTAIEGNTLVLKEVELLLREGKAVGDKPLKDYLEVEGYGKAAEWVYDQARNPGEWTSGHLLTRTEVRHVHAVAMTPVWQVAPHPEAASQESPGNFRRHNIEPFPGGMRPPDWTAVTMLTDDWVASVCRLDDEDLPFPEALARCHNEFERIHPFVDGNGRTGRLVTNLILIRRGYSSVGAILLQSFEGRNATAIFGHSARQTEVTRARSENFWLELSSLPCTGSSFQQ